MYRLIFVLALGVAPQLAWAQSQDLPVPPAAKAVLDAFEKPLHPLVGGVAPGGGLGVGIGYATPKSQEWFHDASTMVTLNRFWSVEGETGRQTQRSRLGVFGEVRHMSRLGFFGIGPGSRREDRTNFRLRETTVGAKGWVRPRAAVRIGGYAEIYSPQLGSGASPSLLSIEDVFHPSDVPALQDDPVFARYRGFAEFAHSTGTYQIAMEAVRDHDLGRYNFHRVETEVQQRFAGFKPGHRLTLHGLMAVTNSDAVVPYYLQYTLGGGGGLKAFRPDMLGSDGTKATLRGYQNYRFRDRDILLMQAEYRIPVHKNVDATVFYDAGQVAGRASDLFDGAKQGTGFSLSYMRKGAALGRIDVGYGSGEGIHVFWSSEGLGF